MAGLERLLVFLKAPRVGTVKTRLAATLGMEAATAAYRTLVATLLREMDALDGVELRYAPDDAAAEIQPWRRPSWQLAAQGSGDLGERLIRAFAEHFADGARKVVVIGADCPDATPDDVRNAWSALDHHDLVVGPAHDGGYWLIGLTSPRPELFCELAWSTDQVLPRTLSRAREMGLRIAQLQTLTDIDVEPEWRAWRLRVSDSNH